MGLARLLSVFGRLALYAGHNVLSFLVLNGSIFFTPTCSLNGLSTKREIRVDL